eukprot:scaffold46710_cov62-Phaeocystis_antarctica.AAC.1
MAHHVEDFERGQCAAVERSSDSGATGLGDLGPAEVERLERRQHSSRRRRRTCRKRRHEGGEALVAERAVTKIESLQSGQPPQGRREGHQPRVVMAALFSWRVWSRGRAPWPRATARAAAAASPTSAPLIRSSVTEGSAPAPSRSTSRSTP